MNVVEKRDDSWLFEKLDYLWDHHFSDVPQENDVVIKFGRKTRRRLGSIKRAHPNRFGFSSTSSGSIITINGLFKDPKIPEFVVLATIAHEMCHYAHGFSSPIEQKFRHPHHGGVVTKEIKSRGLGEILKRQKKWLKDNWPAYIDENLGKQKRRRRIIIKWI